MGSWNLERETEREREARELLWSLGPIYEGGEGGNSHMTKAFNRDV